MLGTYVPSGSNLRLATPRLEMKTPERSRHFLLGLLAIGGCVLYAFIAERNLPITASAVPGHYVFELTRLDGGRDDCLTLTSDGHFVGPGLHTVDDTEPTTGTWRLLTRGRRTFLVIGGNEFPISHHIFGPPTLTLGPLPGPNDCTRQ